MIEVEVVMVGEGLVGRECRSGLGEGKGVGCVDRRH